MLQNTISKKTKTPSFSIPIRLNWNEKYVLEELSKENQMPLSTYIKTVLKPIMQPKLKKLNKSQALIDFIKSKNLKTSEIEESDTIGADLRKNFKLTN